MQPPILTFRHMARSAAVEAEARTLASRLARFDDRIVECHVTIECVSDSAHRPYLVKIDLTLPGAHIHADSLHSDGSGHSGLYPAMHASYENARRQLQHLRAGARHRP